VATLNWFEGALMSENDTSTIDALKATLVRAVECGDAALAASLYAADARVLPPGAQPITDPDGVLDFWQRRIDGGSDGGVLETVRRDEFGDVAVEEGRYGRRSGEDWVDSGKYLAVFRRQSDGSWRYATDIWNSDRG
jgi:ketosteroid isomerase-like protein